MENLPTGCPSGNKTTPLDFPLFVPEVGGGKIALLLCYLSENIESFFQIIKINGSIPLIREYLPY